MSSNLVEITSAPLDLGDKKKAVLLFGASWHEACPPLEAVLSALWGAAGQQVFFGKVDAEEVSDLTEQYQVTVVPTIILMNSNTVLERLEGGVDPSQVTQAVQRLLAAAETPASAGTVTATTTAADPQQALTQRLDRLICRDTVMVFMKGVPNAPRCGFSRQTVELLQQQDIPFGSFDILSDDSVRQGLKTHSSWPTYPQVYVNGELVGGLDILKELAEEDAPLKEQWNITAAGSTNSEHDRLAKLIKRHDIMVFMKGLPSAPGCGFSRQLIEMLDGKGVAYDAFNILEDEEVRQGLKEFSNWPTYPQLYVKGELVGGLDICKELNESDELMDILKQA
jgi:Grx4 family monothiol glutaredoxin